ncbi:MAG: RidA family protein [Steroidobacteraceae bacterium]
MIEAKLKEMGIVLPSPPEPSGHYLPFQISHGLLYLSGQVARSLDGRRICGRVGEDVSAEEAYEHARLAGIRLLAVAEDALGNLDRVSKVVKVLGFVNASPEFRSHPAVIDGCSDLFVEVFGSAGRHARSAIGVSSLPENATVEIEAVLEID